MSFFAFKKTVFVSFVVGSLLFFVSPTYAAWNGKLYKVAETLNPECNPGITNCSVIPPLLTQGDGTITDGNLTLIPTGNAGLILKPSSGSTSEIRFLERSDKGSNYVGFKSPDGLDADLMWTLPSSDGSSNQGLTSNGNKGLSWVTYLTPNSGWAIGGNKGTNAGFDFIGTGDTQSLVFKTNSTERGRFLNDYVFQLGDGSTTPFIIQTNVGSSSTQALVFKTNGLERMSLLNDYILQLGNGLTEPFIVSATGELVFKTNNVERARFYSVGDSSSTAAGLKLSLGSSIPILIDRSSSTTGNWVTMQYGTTPTETFGTYNTLGSPEGVIYANIGSMDTDTASGRVYIKTSSITANTGWVELAQTDTTQIGAIVSYTGTTAPAGYLMADGTSVLKTSYPELFAVMSCAYGCADSTHFNIPDLRGRFLRGSDDMGTGDANRDPDQTSRTASATGGNATGVGSIQTDATSLPNSGFGTNTTGDHSHTYSGSTSSNGNHTHNVSVNDSADAGSTGNGFGQTTGVDTETGGPGGIVINGAGDHVHTYSGATDTTGSHAHTVTGGDSETRPTNIYVNFIVKVGNTPNNVASSYLNHSNDSDGDTYVYTEKNTDEDYLRLGTAGIERLTIDNTGKVGIGTTSPAYALDVLATSTNIARFAGSNNTSCTLSSTGIISCTSDASLKHDIALIGDETLSKIMELKPSSFVWNGGEELGIQYGFIAQEVKEIFPNLVSTDPTTGKLTLAQNGLLPFIIKGMQEQELQISGLQGLKVISSDDLAKTDTLDTDIDRTNIVEFFKEKISSGVKIARELIAQKITAVTGYFKHLNANELCLTSTDGKIICINGDQLKNIGGKEKTIDQTLTPTPVESLSEGIGTSATSSGEVLGEETSPEKEDVTLAIDEIPVEDEVIESANDLVETNNELLGDSNQ